jgi:EmrB/QacA subfamily drug resistance transporter
MNRVMAVAGIPTMLGPILGPVIGGLIITNLSWRWIFFVNLPVGLIGIALAINLLKPSTRDREHRFDVLGFALLSPGLAILVYGLSSVNNPGGFLNHTVLWCLSLGVILTVLFVLRSLKAPEPLIDMSLFRNRYFSVATMCSFLLGASLYGTSFLLPLYYQLARGQSALVAGLMMAPQGVGAALILRKGALLADKRGARKVVPWGMALLVIGTFAYTQQTVNTSFVLLAFSLFVRGIGLGLAMMPVFSAAFQGLRHDQVPRASTASNIIRQVGGSIGVAIMAVVLQAQISRVLPDAHVHATTGAIPYAIGVKLAHAFGNTFWWSLALCGVALIPSLFLPDNPTEAAPKDEGAIAMVE